MKLKKIRRFSWKNTFLSGILTAVAATFLMVLLFALILSFLDVPSPVIRVINQLIKLSAILLGIHFSVSKGDPKAVFKGAFLGFFYMALGVFLYALFTRQDLPLTSYLLDIFLGIAAGGLYGMIKRSKYSPKCDKDVA